MEVRSGRVHVGTDGPADVPAYESPTALVRGLEEESADGTAVQAFDARYVAGREHLRTAVAHANRSVDRGENVADDRSVEILCYAAGRRQIRDAMTMGVGDGTGNIVAVIDGPEEATVADRIDALLGSSADVDPATEDSVTGDPETIASFFDVTRAERSATTASLEALVRERVALLDVEK